MGLAGYQIHMTVGWTEEPAFRNRLIFLLFTAVWTLLFALLHAFINLFVALLSSLLTFIFWTVGSALYRNVNGGVWLGACTTTDVLCHNRLAVEAVGWTE
ncbi:hypothetical protein JCM10207_004721, partial [Rhodosporidiobolus poonsookiae]